MGGQQKDFISDIVFFQHQDGMRLKVRRHFLQSMMLYIFLCGSLVFLDALKYCARGGSCVACGYLYSKRYLSS
jgi:hypothetical protein